MQPSDEVDVIDECSGEEFGDGMVVYIDTRAMDVQVIVRIEVGFGSEDTGDGNEGEDEDRVRYSCSSPLEVMLTGGDRAKSGSKDRDMNKTP